MRAIIRMEGLGYWKKGMRKGAEIEMKRKYCIGV